MTVNGLAVLTAIPIVVLALWADYFGRYLTESEAEEVRKTPKFERSSELIRVRLAGFYAFLSQLALYLGTTDFRKENALICNSMFIISILAQVWIQAGMERKVRGPQQGAGQFRAALRMFYWAWVAGLIYGVALIGSVVAFGGVAQLLHLSKPAIGAFAIIGAIIGVCAGIIINFALGAYYRQKMFKTTEVTKEDHESLYRLLVGGFENEKIPVPGLWIIEGDSLQTNTAFVAGFKGGRGIFRPGLFITKSLLNLLTDEELRAVILHEVSHVALAHLKKRFLMSSLAIFTMTFTGIFLILLMHFLVPQATLAATFISAVVFFFAFSWLNRQSTAQEIEADIYSIQKLGSSLDALSSALKKIAGRESAGVEFRIKVLCAYFEKQSTLVAPSISKDDEQKDKAA